MEEYGSQKNLEDLSRKLWQQIKTEHAPEDNEIEETGYSPPPFKEEFYYDSYYNDSDGYIRDPLDTPTKRPADDTPSSSGKKRGRPYHEASVKITCLEPGTTAVTNEALKLQEEGLGIPKSEIVGGLRAPSKLPLNWSAEELKNHIHKLFPRVQKFMYMKCNKAKGLFPLPDDIRPSDLRQLLGRSGLYIVPIEPLLSKESVQDSDPPVPDQSCASTAESAQTTSSSGFSYWLPIRVDGEKVSEDDGEFKITLDVSSYKPGEITVKTKETRVVVHAKHEEREDEYGKIKREMTREYNLPKNVDPNKVTSSLSASGILTLKAPKLLQDVPKERIIPIFHEAPE